MYKNKNFYPQFKHTFKKINKSIIINKFLIYQAKIKQYKVKNIKFQDRLNQLFKNKIVINKNLQLMKININLNKIIKFLNIK